jgi:hypothetical protein
LTLAEPGQSQATNAGELLVDTLLYGSKALLEAAGHLLMAAWNSLLGRRDAARVQWHQALNAVHLEGLIDGAALLAASQTCKVAIQSLLPALGAILPAGPLGPCITMLMYGLGEGVALWTYRELDVRNHWMPRINALFSGRQPTTWVYGPRATGGYPAEIGLNDPENKAPHELCCPVTLEMV